MIFDDLEGNERVFSELKKKAASGQVSHAYIFEGDASIDKELVAKAFIKAILCRERRGSGCDVCAICRKIEHGNHEDVFVLEKDGNSVKDEKVSELQERLKNKPLGERNIAVIKNADTMTVRAQNRLLKTLEEPPLGTVLILLSENTENLLKTIVSRCVVVRLTHAEALADHEMEELAGRTAIALLDGRTFHEIKRSLDSVLTNRDEARAFLDALEHFYGVKATSEDAESLRYPKEYIFRQVSAIEQARRDLTRNGSVGYVMKGLLLRSLAQEAR